MPNAIVKQISFPGRRIENRNPDEIGAPSDAASIAAFQEALEELAEAERLAAADDDLIRLA